MPELDTANRKLVDDAGREVPAVNLQLLLQSPDLEVRALVDVARIVHRRQSGSTAAKLVKLILVLTLVCGAMIAYVEFPDPWGLLPGIALVAGLLVYQSRFVAPRFRRTLRTIMLEGGYCAACAYDLSNAAKKGELTTCPECGARWAMNCGEDKAPPPPADR